MIFPLSGSKDVFKVIFQRAQCLKTFRKYKSCRVLWGWRESLVLEKEITPSTEVIY